MTSVPSVIARPEPMFLGYALKEYEPRPAWHGDPRVSVIASVTECNAPRPEGWVDAWDFNAAGYYATSEHAEGAFSGEVPRERFAMFAYELFPLRFFGGHVASVGVASVLGKGPDAFPGKLEPGFEFIGYDAVERWAEPTPGKARTDALGGGFGCSPLFCNMQSVHHPVNTYCLLSEWNDAVRAAQQFGADQPEPGCYYIFGVYVRPHTLGEARIR